MHEPQLTGGLTPGSRPPVNPEEILTLNRAAEVAGVSLSTMKRRREELRDHGAQQTAEGWRIPVSALIALGMLDKVNAGSEPQGNPQLRTPLTPPTSEPPSSTDDDAHHLIGQLRAQLAEAEQRAAVAEAQAEERAQRLADKDAERERLERQHERVLGLLEMRQTSPEPEPEVTDDSPVTAVPAPAPEPAPQPQAEPVGLLGRWGRRLRG